MKDKLFHLRLVTPDRILVEGEASAVIVPGTDGDFTVLPGHMNLISTLRPGEIEVHIPGTQPKIFKITSGFADVGNHHCTILAEGLTV